MRLHPLFEDDGQGGEFTPEQAKELKKSYDKLQAEYTKVTQKNSELSKNEEKVKPWTDFDAYLDANGIDKTAVGQAMDKIITDLKAGKAPTAATMANLDKQIDNAPDKATQEKLEALQEHVYEVNFEKELGAIERLAKDDGIEYTEKAFKTYLGEYLEELGFGDDDEFDMIHLKKAYKLFKADARENQSNKPTIPPLGTSGGASSPNKGEKEKVGGIAGAAAKARALRGA